MGKRAALILAGGKARRFQTGEEWQDKALAPLHGKPLLVHAVENVAGVVDEVLVCVNDEERGAKYADVLKSGGHTGVGFVVDEQNSLVKGPNAAIMSGLRLAHADYCLTLPCDMPFLKPKVADYLLNEASDYQVVVPMWPNGRLETLMMALQRKSALQIADCLCHLNRPRSDDFPRGAEKVLFTSPVDAIKNFDPELTSFININSPRDLTHPENRHTHGPVKKNLPLTIGKHAASTLKTLRLGAPTAEKAGFVEAQQLFSVCVRSFEEAESFFWAGVAGESLGETLHRHSKLQHESVVATELDFEGKEAFRVAANDYRLEAEMFDEYNCRLLSERAWADKAWCESWAMGKHSHIHRYPPKVARN
jgi:molybdenum cofactor guanylyltransferase